MKIFLSFQIIETQASIVCSTSPVCPNTNVVLTTTGGSLGTGANWYWYYVASVSTEGTSRWTVTDINARRAEFTEAILMDHSSMMNMVIRQQYVPEQSSHILIILIIQPEILTGEEIIFIT